MKSVDKKNRSLTKYRTLFIATLFLMAIMQTGCGSNVKMQVQNTSGNHDSGAADVSSSANVSTSANVSDSDVAIVPVKTGSMRLDYATEYAVDYYTDGYAYISVHDDSEYVVVPQGCDNNNLGYPNATIINMPLDNIYLAATSAMDLFRCLDSMDNIVCCSTKAEDYSIKEVKEYIEQGKMTYVGKYSAPDYETLLDKDCSLAIESTMIYHSPKVKEQLEELGIPVLVERSSYETDPLGRLEWIKLYGLLIGKEQEASQFFDECVEKTESVSFAGQSDGAEEKTVLFFYITSNGYVNVHKPGDYVTKMIEMAGGRYALDQIPVDEENSLSTMNILWEDFYLYGVDADILIYNSTIDGGIKSIQDLIDKNPVLADFKSVKDGNVWCTGKNMFQESSCIADIIVDFNKVINGNDEDIKYINKVE